MQRILDLTRSASDMLYNISLGTSHFLGMGMMALFFLNLLSPSKHFATALVMAILAFAYEIYKRKLGMQKILLTSYTSLFIISLFITDIFGLGSEIPYFGFLMDVFSKFAVGILFYLIIVSPILLIGIYITRGLEQGVRTLVIITVPIFFVVINVLYGILAPLKNLLDTSLFFEIAFGGFVMLHIRYLIRDEDYFKSGFFPR